MQINRLHIADADFDSRLEALLAWESVSDDAVASTVAGIIADIRAHGDDKLVELTNRFDRRDVRDASELELSGDQLQQAFDRVPQESAVALQTAADRITAFHQRQLVDSWRYEDEHGTVLGQCVTPIDKVGLYVPGGKAAYPSSVLMNAIPAKVAGVGELVMVVPAPGGALDDLVLAAAKVADVDRVLTIGGAQAVAALAYGTDLVPAVDKIVGPGNIYVATAKRAVFGKVGIDMIAGPSEICVVCDGKTNVEWVAADLFSQAEHDEQAQAILICDDGKYIDEVVSAMSDLMESMPRSAIITESMRERGCAIEVDNLDQAVELVNRIAPEHLELSVADPESLLSGIRHAGAIFMGRYSAEALGDYCAGPNHVLPTSGTARFSSPLGVYDFQKRTSLIGCSAEGAALLGRTAAILARGEGLEAHAVSAEARFNHARD
jgi:histidinol dehydrogenase